MKRFLVFLTLVAVGTQCCFGQAIRGELQLRYRAFDHAIQHRDAGFFDKFLAPDFVAEFPNGQGADRAGTIKGFTDLMNAIQRSSWTFQLSDLKIVANGVSVKAKGDLTATAVGPDKKKHRLHMQGLTQDVWALQNNVWTLDHVKFIELHAFIDGKPVSLDGLNPSVPNSK